MLRGFEMRGLIPNYESQPTRMYKVIVSGNEYEVVENENGLHVNKELLAWDLVKTGDRHFHIIYQNKGYQAELVKIDRVAKSLSLKINGATLEVIVKDRFDLLLERMGMDASASGKINSIKAPMPGLIIDLKVKPGDSVQAGDALLVLEAMKMENVIKSPGEGVVKNVMAKKGESVEKNQVLIEF